MAAPKLKLVQSSQDLTEHRVADTDDGYTRLANELLEELIGANLTRNQAKVAFAVCRKTYGFNKKTDRIADSQLSELTRLPRQKVNKAKNELIAMKVLIKDGLAIGPNKNLSEWIIPDCHQDSVTVTKSVTKSVTKIVTAVSPKQGHTKDNITKDKKDNTQTHEVGLSDDEKLTPRQKGTNPRAKGTNPRSAMPAFDRERLKNTWNSKAEKHGLPKIRSVTTTVENGVKRLWVSYLKQCRELGREPRDIDGLLNGYIEFGYTPTAWACGANPEGKKYGIETALRQEKIDQILAEDA